MASPPFLLLLLLFLLSLVSTPLATTTTTGATSNATILTNLMNTTVNPLSSLCHSLPYPSSCLSSLDLSISISISPPSPSSLLTLLFHSLSSALAAATNLSPLLSSSPATLPAVQDCRDLHSFTISSLHRTISLLSSSSSSSRQTLGAARAHLAAALTNKNTCLDSLSAASFPLKPTLISSLLSAYSHVTNSLSLLPRPPPPPPAAHHPPANGNFPAWVPRKDRRLLESDVSDYDSYGPDSILTVAADGTGNFTTVGEAVAFAPNNSDDRTIIIVRSGVYVENVDIPAYKTNIVLLGEGRDVTVIRGNRSVGDGWTTFRSATVAVSGEGFLARDISLENTAGPRKGQAVALRINADLAAVYRCSISGYQDTLYLHSFRQFYRECVISGTVDFIFGNAAAVIQASNLTARLPLPGQSVMITAQSRDDPNEATGFSIQNCSLVPADDLANSPSAARTYLGRPWKPYSTVVYIESYIDGMVDPAGWSRWSAGDDEGLDTVYYGEYMNGGPGAETGGRVDWPGFHIMDYDEAYNFTVSQLIYGDEWLDSTSFPYDDGI